MGRGWERTPILRKGEPWPWFPSPSSQGLFSQVSGESGHNTSTRMGLPGSGRGLAPGGLEQSMGQPRQGLPSRAPCQALVLASSPYSSGWSSKGGPWSPHRVTPGQGGGTAWGGPTAIWCIPSPPTAAYANSPPCNLLRVC